MVVWHNHDSTCRVERIVADELGVPASEIEVRRDEHGKPEIHRPVTDLRFSVSRSPGVMLVALARAVDVGVDVERVDRDTKSWALWRHALNPAELDRFPAAADARHVHLLRTWVAKEAILKATGVGLGVDPREIELGANGNIVALPGSFGSPDEWWLTEVGVTGYVAALACRRSSSAERLRSSHIETLG